MTRQPNRTRDLFLAALKVPSDQRQAYLRAACADDRELEAQVESLIAAHFELGSVAGLAGFETTQTFDGPVESIRPGDVFAGRFKLLEQIGEGGMGTVWLAEQTEPVQRRVAIKLIRTGMDSRLIVARFDAERQALALMDHPNIAKVFDGGATPDGRPFFVIELVKGTPITKFCDEKRFSVRQRLELFADVCRAVQHAHQKGIIHRDIKPSNVLVAPYDGRPAVKVIDFGVAKATGQKLTELTLFTGFGAVVGTPEYMSPEQAEVNNQDVDTRSDIYSLGVLLYELLTGSTPLTRKRVQEAALMEVLRVIREEEPPKPSTRLSSTDELPSISAQRQSEPAKLTKLVRGELDWIVMKALEKDRDRRYETANGLAMDIQRYLADEQVLACPPSAGYRLRKFARKNQTALTTATVIGLLLVAGITVSTWQAVRATRAETAAQSALVDKGRALEAEAEQRQQARTNEQKAQTEAALANAVKEFLLKDLLQLAAARQQYRERATGVKMDPYLKVRDLVLRAAQKIEGKFKDQPLVEAEIRWTLGWTLDEIGRPDLALPQFLRVRELYTAHRGPDHDDTLESMTRAAHCYAALGKHTEAFKLREETLRIRYAKLGPDDPLTLVSRINLANSYHTMGEHAEALKRYEEALAIQKEKLGPNDRDTLRTMNNLAISYDVAGRKQEALELREKTLQLQKDNLGPDDLDTLQSMNNLAISYEDAKRPQDALKLDQEAFQLRKAKLGPDHPDTLVSMSNLALSYKAVGQLPEALRLYEEVLPLWKAKVGPDHSDTIMSMYNLGVLRRRSKKYEGAEELLLGCQSAIASGQKGIHPHVRANTTRELTRLYDAWDKPAEADKWLKQMPANKQIEYAFERHAIWPLLWGWPRW